MSLKQAFLQSDLPNKSELITLIKPGILLLPSETEDNEGIPGRSRIGGTPELPEGTRWPYSGNLPLAFIAQINLEELPDIQERQLLPAKGILYFFYEPTQNFDTAVLPPESPIYKVIYNPDSPLPLKRLAFPPELAARYRLEPSCISFTVTETFAGIADPFSGSLDDFLNSFSNDMEILDIVRENSTTGHQVLGYSDNVQGHFEGSCDWERLKRLHPQKSWDEIKDMAVSGAKEWVLLFQSPSWDGKFGTDWGYDGATVYFVIHKDDLLAGNFNETWFVFQDH